MKYIRFQFSFFFCYSLFSEDQCEDRNIEKKIHKERLLWKLDKKNWNYIRGKVFRQEIFLDMSVIRGFIENLKLYAHVYNTNRIFLKTSTVNSISCKQIKTRKDTHALQWNIQNFVLLIPWWDKCKAGQTHFDGFWLLYRWDVRTSSPPDQSCHGDCRIHKLQQKVVVDRDDWWIDSIEEN